MLNCFIGGTGVQKNKNKTYNPQHGNGTLFRVQDGHLGVNILTIYDV